MHYILLFHRLLKIKYCCSKAIKQRKIECLFSVCFYLIDKNKSPLSECIIIFYDFIFENNLSLSIDERLIRMMRRIIYVQFRYPVNKNIGKLRIENCKMRKFVASGCYRYIILLRIRSLIFLSFAGFVLFFFFVFFFLVNNRNKTSH